MGTGLGDQDEVRLVTASRGRRGGRLDILRLFDVHRRRVMHKLNRSKVLISDKGFFPLSLYDCCPAWHARGVPGLGGPRSDVVAEHPSAEILVKCEKAFCLFASFIGIWIGHGSWHQTWLSSLSTARVYFLSVHAGKEIRSLDVGYPPDQGVLAFQH